MLAKQAKIARAKNNGKDIAIFAKKVGSNYFLRNRRLEFSWQNPYKVLAAPAPAASTTDENRFLCWGQDSNLRSLAAPDLQSGAIVHSATPAR